MTEVVGPQNFEGFIVVLYVPILLQFHQIELINSPRPIDISNRAITCSWVYKILLNFRKDSNCISNRCLCHPSRVLFQNCYSSAVLSLQQLNISHSHSIPFAFSIIKKQMGCIQSSAPKLQIKKVSSNINTIHNDDNKHCFNSNKSFKNQPSSTSRDNNRRKNNKVQFLDLGVHIQQTENVILSTQYISDQDKSMLDEVLCKNYIFHKLSSVQRKQLIIRFVGYESVFDCQKTVSLTAGYSVDPYVFKKNEVGTMFFVVKSGNVEVQLEGNKQNKKISRKIMGRGESFGQLALLYKTVRSASVKCLQKSSFLCLSGQTFRQVLENVVERSLQSNKILIQRIKLFQYLGPKQKNKLANNITMLKYEKGDIIFRQGQQSMAFYVIGSGKVQIQIRNKPLLQLRPGDHFGQSCFNEGSKRSGTAQCLQKTQLMSISRQTLRKILGNQGKQFYFYSILKWSLKRSQTFNQIPANSLQKLLRQSDIVFFKHDRQISKQGDKVRKLYIPIQGCINSHQMGDIVNSQYLPDIQSGKKVSLTNQASLVKDKQGHVCVMDINKVLSVLQRHSISLINMGPGTPLQVKGTIKSKKQLCITHYRDPRLLREYTSSIKIEHLNMVSKISDGQFGPILKVRNKLDDSFHALKCFRKSQVDLSKMRHFVQQQIQVMSFLKSHEFIVGFEKYYQTSEFILILMQLIKGKDFFDTIVEIGWLSSQLVRFFFGAYVLAIQHLHEKDIIYRDIKPQNAVVQPSGYLKLIDLGTARRLSLKTGFRSFTIIGTPHYMAPQVIAGKGYSFEADIWSLGILLFEISCGHFPFGQKLQQPIHIYNQIIKPNSNIIYPKRLKDKSIKSLIQRLLIKDQSVRQIQNFTQIKETEFFQGFEWDKFQNKTMKSPFRPQVKYNLMDDSNENKNQPEQTLAGLLEKLEAEAKKGNPKVDFTNWDEF